MSSSVRLKGTILGLCLSAVFLYFALRKVEFDNFQSVLSTADYWFLLPITLAYFVFYLLKVYRWQMLLGKSEQNSFKDFLYPLMIGFAANNVFPFRAGEFIRVYIGGTTLKTPRARILGSIVAERLFDLLAIGIVVLAALVAAYFNQIFSGIGVKLITTIAIATLGAIALLGCMIVLAVRYKGQLESVLSKWLPDKINTHIVSFASGFEQTRGFTGGLIIVANSVLQWAALALCVMWSLQAVGIENIQSLAASASSAGSAGNSNLMVLLIIATITLGVMILGISMPSTVAFIGTIEYAFVLSLGFFEIGPDHALAAGVFYHAIAFCITTFAGLVCYVLYRLHHHAEPVPADT